MAHPIEMAKHKLNFPLRMFSALTDNQDFFGEQIRDPYAPAGKQLAQTGEYVAKSFLPFGVQGYLATESPRARALNLIGITKVPRLYSNTPAMNVIDEYNKMNRAAMTTKQGAEEKRLKKELRGLAKDEDTAGFQEAAEAALTEGTLTRQQVKAIIDESQAPPGLGRFVALPVEWQIRAWEKASEKEKEVWQPFFLKKIMTASPEIKIRNKEALVPTLKKMGLDNVADTIENLSISEKGKKFNLSALGVKRPMPTEPDMGQVDTHLSQIIQAQMEKQGTEKPKKSKKNPYAFLGLQSP
jgi:hypothetical protein